VTRVWTRCASISVSAPCASDGPLTVATSALCVGLFRFSHTLWGGRFNHVIIVDDADKAKRILEMFRLDIVWPFGETPGCNLLFRVASLICSIRSSIIPSLLATHIKASSPLLSSSRSGLTSTYSATGGGLWVGSRNELQSGHVERAVDQSHFGRVG
jgi:hypothetical protein